MSGLVVIVDFRLKPGADREFRPLVEANADASVRNEPGCRRFDVVVSKDDARRILLYEIYDDAAAFEAHCRSVHFTRFDRDSERLVETKSVILADLVREASGDPVTTGGD